MDAVDRDGPEPRLRVCLLVAHFPPNASGAERQALAQARELVRQGHQVQVVTSRVEGLPLEAVEDGILVHRRVRSVRFGPLFGLSFVAGVIDALAKLRPTYDLVHTHQALWEAVAAGLGREVLRGAPVLLQPASAGFYGEAQELMRTRGASWLRRLVLRNDRVAAISHAIADEWRALGMPSDRIIPTASGVDAEHFRPGPAPEALEAQLPARPRVLFTGRLHPQKNLDVLIDVWPEVARRTGASLLLAGAGPDRQRLEERVESLGLKDQVRFLGAVADPADILRAADLFILPSVAEGMSNSLLEAMASGLPSVVSAIGGNVDLITEGVHGLLVPPDDRAGWIAALSEGLKDPVQSRDRGAAARARIEIDFALPVVVRRNVGIYRQMLAEIRRDF